MKIAVLVLYNIWAYFSFFFLAAVGVPWYLIVLLFRLPGKYFYLYSRIWAKVWTRLVFIRCEVKGKEHIRKDQSYVIVCNHQSVADLFIVAYALEMDYRPLGKEGLKKIPILGYLFAKALIFVKRGDQESRRASVGVLKETIQSGISVLIFPEGTRNRTGKPLKDFYSGAFRISTETDTPILPMLITNTMEITPQDSVLGRPGTIHCEFLPPVEPKGKDYKTLQNELFDLMWKYVDKHDSVLGSVDKK